MRFLTNGLILLAAVIPWAPAAAATLTVDRTDHAPQASACTDAPLDCSLTGAIELANISTGPDIVVLTADNFRLQDTGVGPIVRSEILVRGAGMDQTLVEATIAYRSAAFEVLAGGNLTLQDLTISGFTNITGGAVVISGEANAHAELQAVTVASSRGNSMGAGITVRPATTAVEPKFRLRLIDSVVRNNLAEGQDSGLPCAGAGLALHNGPVHIENSEITENNAEVLARGGGLCIGSDVEVRLINSVLSRNESLEAGAGIYSENGILRLEGSTVLGNRLRSAPYRGAGIYAMEGIVELVGITFLQNGNVDPFSATDIHARDLLRFTLRDSTTRSLSITGVGIEILNVPLVEIANVEVSGLRTGITLSDIAESTIENLTIDRTQSGHSALNVNDSQDMVVRSLTVLGAGGGSPSRGAALVAQFADIRLENCFIADNQVADDGSPNSGQGGAIWVQQSNLHLDGCSLVGNMADDSGGAIYARDSNLAITQSSIYRNGANDGSGIVQFGGTLSASNSTISGNLSSGVSALRVAGFGTAELRHVTILGPQASLSNQQSTLIELVGSTVTFANTAMGAGLCNLFFSGSEPESLGGNVATDASCLRANSDDLLTDDLRILPLAPINSERVIHLPQAGSPLINAAMGCPAIDQRGVPRTEPCDTGSVELTPDDDFLFFNSFES